MLFTNLWKQWILSSRKARRRSAGRALATPAHVERFETRCFLSISSIFNSATGALAITSNGADAITIGSDSAGNVTLNGSVLNVTNGGVTGPVAANTIVSLTVNGGVGNNKIGLSGVTSTVFTKLTSTKIDGGAGNDNLTGSGLDDSIVGGIGNDSINGSDGNDDINGDTEDAIDQEGNDTEEQDN